MFLLCPVTLFTVNSCRVDLVYGAQHNLNCGYLCQQTASNYLHLFQILQFANQNPRHQQTITPNQIKE